MKKFTLLAMTTFVISLAPAAIAQTSPAQQLSENDKRMIFLTCINRKPIKPINASAAQECARVCNPTGVPVAAQVCLDAYKAATGRDYVSMVKSVPPSGQNPVPSSSARGTGNYPPQ